MQGCNLKDSIDRVQGRPAVQLDSVWSLEGESIGSSFFLPPASMRNMTKPMQKKFITLKHFIWYERCKTS
jgi:hypothetical protein